MSLPCVPENVIVPPIKCQGIKTKLVPFIMQNIRWDGSGRWIEPFLGSGVILFNLRPQRALVCDINPHIINFYQQVYNGRITPATVRNHLQNEGDKLLTNGRKGKKSYYYQVRERFNAEKNSLDFLFLSRACFNGMMRFNQRGAFNVPFCRKPDRFRPAYITKIVNQVKVIQGIMRGKEWIFRVGDWRTCLENLDETDFVYLDPPYIGRHTDYFNQWSESEAVELAEMTHSIPGGFALSMWKENKYRVNEHIPLHWNHTIERTQTHFYHVGPTEDLRNAMEESLLIKPGFTADPPESTSSQATKPVQLSLQF